MPAARCGWGRKRGLGAGPGLLWQWRLAATVTDANVVLGYLDAPPSWAANVPLDRAASEAASIASPRRWSYRASRPPPASTDMINLNMADGIRLMTLRRGSIRKFALLSFGGAAGLHAAEVARELEIKRIIVPTVASVLSAWGMLTSDLRYEVSRTHYGAAARITADECASCLPAGAAGRRPAASWFNGRLQSSAPPRCATASRSLRSTSRSTASTGTPPIWSTDRGPFHVRHEELLHLRLARPGGGFVNARVGVVESRQDEGAREAAASSACLPRDKRQAFFGGWREVPVYALDDLQPDHTLTGPAIIEAETTTVLVDTGDRVP
jgi:N-methylhydantoinase A